MNGTIKNKKKSGGRGDHFLLLIYFSVSNEMYFAAVLVRVALAATMETNAHISMIYGLYDVKPFFYMKSERNKKMYFFDGAGGND